jgi:hypothetical protein
MKPTLGRVVIYTDCYTGHEHAAHVSQVNEDGTVNLFVLGHRGGTYTRVDVKESKKSAKGCWHWPVIEKPAAKPKEEKPAEATEKKPDAQ